jgi:ferredoxin
MGAVLHQIDLEACKGDNICAEICPEDILEMVDGKVRSIDSMADKCIVCGQCVAVCPNDALQMPSLPAELFQDLEKWSFEYDEFLAFLRTRRSVRNFKNKPVDRELLDKVVQAASTAPMGWPPHTTEILVIDDQAELDQLLKDTVADYKKVVSAVSNPLIRPLVKWKVGAELFHTIQKFVIPVAETGIKDFEKDGSDAFNRGAPVLMLFHANRWTPSCEENAHLACAFAMLAAQSVGLGATVIGMTPPVVDESKELRKRYGIPAENKVITSLILGHPKYKYKKSVKREFPSVRYI